ncbi:MAG: adenosylmethionine decarboxylase [Candidatus Aenigmarchaeota archaeon]|nr:adenosylmethionine decarboxylase [Candidatus Aenigmarchaeota archaeon]
MIEKNPTAGNGKRIVGRHFYGNLYNCKANLADENFLRDVVLEAVKVSNSELVEYASYRFGEGKYAGISIVAIVAESHISIHTWPEYGYATVDVYTCGEYTKPEEAFDFIVEKLKPGKFTKHQLDRSLE